MSPGKPAMAPAPEDPADAGRQACVLPYLIERTAATMIDEIRQFVLDSLTDMNYSIDGIDDDMLARMSTVTSVVGLLRDLRVGSAHD